MDIEEVNRLYYKASEIPGYLNEVAANAAITAHWPQIYAVLKAAEEWKSEIEECASTFGNDFRPLEIEAPLYFAVEALKEHKP